jgi:hypothetical protein
MSIFYHSLKNDLPEYREKIASRDEHFQMPPVENGRMYPVSTIWEPSFDLMTPLVGTVMDKEREAEGYWMTMYGRPRLATQKPLPSGQTPADILFSGLERHAGQHVPERGVFVDIGAGLGYYTNAAASHGQDVYAYEWYREHGINLRAAVDYNGYASNVKIDTDFAKYQRLMPCASRAVGTTLKFSEARIYSLRAKSVRTCFSSSSTSTSSGRLVRTPPRISRNRSSICGIKGTRTSDTSVPRVMVAACALSNRWAPRVVKARLNPRRGVD